METFNFVYFCLIILDFTLVIGEELLDYEGFGATECDFYIDPELPSHFDVESNLRNWSNVDDNGLIARCNGQFSYCMVLWKFDSFVEVNYNNETQLNASVLFKGCWKSQQGSDCDQTECITHRVANNPIRNITPSLFFCCCDGLFCNSNYSFVPVPPDDKRILRLPVEFNERKNSGWLLWGFLASFCVCTFVILLSCWRFCSIKGKLSKEAYVESGKLLPVECTTNESSSGVTIPSPVCDLDLSAITLIELIGRGRYGSVYRACCLTTGESVAVKVYQTQHYGYFRNECHVYSLPIVAHHHQCLLFYYGGIEKYTQPDEEELEGNDVSSDCKSLRREFWLVTKYMNEGTLHDFLKAQTVDWARFCQMAVSIAKGLSFLHCELNKDGVHKPAIAHRDMNSRNVLLKEDGSCVICDLGFALALDKQNIRSDDCIDEATIAEVGTVRYMAPEVLEGAVNLRDPETALKQIDVYATGLVFWEIISRCSDLYMLSGHSTPAYSAPYTREVAQYPTLEQMQIYICKNKVRPVFPAAVYKLNIQIPALRALKELIEDCWDHDGEARITSLCATQRCLDMQQMSSGIRLANRQQNLLNSANGCLTNEGQELNANDLATYYFNERTAANSSLTLTSGHGSMGPSGSELDSRQLEYQNNHHPPDSPVPVQPYQGRNPCQERNLFNLMPLDHSSDDNSSSGSGENTHRVTRSSFKKVDPCSAESLAKHLMSTRDPERKATNEPTEQLLALLLMRTCTNDTELKEKINTTNEPNNQPSSSCSPEKMATTVDL